MIYNIVAEKNTVNCNVSCTVTTRELSWLGLFYQATVQDGLIKWKDKMYVFLYLT